MTYVSYSFVLFVSIVCVLYYVLPKRYQWKVLLSASIIFYICSSLIFFGYLLIFSIVTWYGTQKIEECKNKQEGQNKIIKGIMILLVLLNGGVLFALKWGAMGIALFNKIVHTSFAYHFVLPLGISFFTFQNISYVIDVYKGRVEAERYFGHYLLYSCYFPYIVSGPINRYEKMKSQLFEGHSCNFQLLYAGILRIIWGYIKKMVIADRAAIFVDEVFNHYYMYRGLYIVIAVVLFTLQLYMDFSGCMDIVIGVSKLFGIDMQENFYAPFGAVSTAEFWRKWHVSLTSWFRDYIYIPLGGNRKGAIRKYINILIVFLICGMWHGAGITFLVWGFLNGFYQIIGEVTYKFRQNVCNAIGLNQNSYGAMIRKRIITFGLAEIAWLFFRANGISEAIVMLRRMVMEWNPWILFDGNLYQLGLEPWDFLILIVGVVCVGWTSRTNKRRDLHRMFLEQDWLCQVIVILVAIVIWYLLGIYGPEFNPNNFIYYNF